MSGLEEPLCDDLGELESCLGIDDAQRPAPRLFGRAKAWGAGFLAQRKKKFNSVARRDPQESVIFSGSTPDTPTDYQALPSQRGSGVVSSSARWEALSAGATPWGSPGGSPAASKSVGGHNPHSTASRAATVALMRELYRGVARGIDLLCLLR